MKKILEVIFRKKSKAQSEDIGDIEKSELELLTDKLINETVGTDGEIMSAFRRMTQKYNSVSAPIGENEVKEIMENLINIAIAKRRMLATRIEKSVETGELFERYYNRLQVINNLTNIAHTKMRRMQDAEQDYLYQNAIYNKVLEKAYENDAIPKASDVIKEEPVDLWRAIFKAGGLEDAQDS